LADPLAHRQRREEGQREDADGQQQGRSAEPDVGVAVVAAVANHRIGE